MLCGTLAAAVQSLRSKLMELGPGKGPGLLHRLIARASSLPIIFEDRIATQRLCGIVYNTAHPCPTFFSNLAIYLDASTAQPEVAAPSPVLAPRRTPAPVPLPHGAPGGIGPLTAVGGLSGDGFRRDAAAVPRQVALEAAAAAQDPQVAAARVPPQEAGVASAGYTARTINMIAGACANVLQAHGPAANHLKVWPCLPGPPSLFCCRNAVLSGMLERRAEEYSSKRCTWWLCYLRQGVSACGPSSGAQDRDHD